MISIAVFQDLHAHHLPDRIVAIPISSSYGQMRGNIASSAISHAPPSAMRHLSPAVRMQSPLFQHPATAVHRHVVNVHPSHAMLRERIHHHNPNDAHDPFVQRFALYRVRRELPDLLER